MHFAVVEVAQSVTHNVMDVTETGHTVPEMESDSRTLVSHVPIVTNEVTLKTDAIPRASPAQALLATSVSTESTQ